MDVKLKGKTTDELRLYLFASTNPGDGSTVKADVEYPEGSTETLSVDYSTEPPTVTPARSRLA